MVSRKRKIAKVEAASLKQLREAAGLKQAEVAEAGTLLQGDISKLENRVSLDVVMLGTLRRYVEALGGELRLVAAFGTKTYELAGAEEEPSTAKKK